MRAPSVAVHSLNEHDEAVRVHFSMPEVQYIGSTSGCGCDFPFQEGDWPPLERPGADHEAGEWHNMEALAGLLRAAGEETVEFYGLWVGGHRPLTEPPLKREEIPFESLLAGDFHFKEGGFYTVRLSEKWCQTPFSSRVTNASPSQPAANSK